MSYTLNIEEFTRPIYGFLVNYKFATFTLYLLAFVYLTQSVYAQTSPSDASSGHQDFKIQSRQYGDWTYRCLLPAKQAEDKSEPKCEISQSLQAEQNGTNVELFNVALIRANDKAGKVK